MFISVFKRQHHLCQSWSRLIQLRHFHISLRSIVILSSHHLTHRYFPLSFRFPTKTLYAFPFSPIHNTCPTHLSSSDLITQIISAEQHKSCSSPLCSFLQSPVISSLTRPNIFLTIPFLNTLSLCSSLNVRDQVSHTHMKQQTKYSSVYCNFYILDWMVAGMVILKTQYNVMYHHCEVPILRDVKTPWNPNTTWCTNTMKSQYNMMYKHCETPVQRYVQSQWNPNILWGTNTMNPQYNVLYRHPELPREQ